MKYLKLLREFYKSPQSIIYGVLYPIGLIAACMLAEYFESCY